MKTRMILLIVVLVGAACSLISFTSIEKSDVKAKSSIGSSNNEPVGGFISEDKL